MPKPLRLVAAVAAACFLSTAPGSLGSPQVSDPHLRESPRLARIYDTILAANFSDARRELARNCPPAPTVACDVLGVVTRWWEIQQNPASRQLDGLFAGEVTRAIAAAEAWTEREPGTAEAWFYYAAARAPRVQWRVLRGQRLAAAREGSAIKSALERALSLDPAMQDAYFGIGLYHYYAGVAPAALRFLRFLLLLPGGDRALGLQEMLRARDGGELLRGEADYQLHFVYLWYEEQPERALGLLRALDARYPSNAVFLERLPETQHENVGDHAASAASWQALLARADAGRVAMPEMAGWRARIGLAAELVELAEAQRAIDLLTPLVTAQPSEPYGAVARALLVLGDAYALIGARDRALDAYARAIDQAPSDDAEWIRTRARRAMSALRSGR